MKRICPCFTPSRIALAEGARETGFLHRERDSHRIKRNDHFMFSQQPAKSKNETKIKTSLRARGPTGVSGALCSLRILPIGRIGSECTHL